MNCSGRQTDEDQGIDFPGGVASSGVISFYCIIPRPKGIDSDVHKHSNIFQPCRWKVSHELLGWHGSQFSTCDAGVDQVTHQLSTILNEITILYDGIMGDMEALVLAEMVKVSCY